MRTSTSFTDRVGFTFGVASATCWITLYVLALQDFDFRVNRWLAAAVMGVQLYLLTETTRRFRPRPRPVLQPTGPRIRFAQLVYFSSHAVLVLQGVRGMAEVAAYDGTNDRQMVALFMAMALAMSVNIAVGFGLCYHNVLFWVMPPDEESQVG